MTNSTDTAFDSAATFAVRHINVSAARPIEASTLLAAIQSGSAPSEWSHHLHAFFDETDLETLSDIVRSGALTYAQLARGARAHLPPGHETRLWLDERA